MVVCRQSMANLAFAVVTGLYLAMRISDALYQISIEA